MAIERKWQRQDTVLFISDGGEDGLVTLNSVLNFKVKMKVVLSSATKPDLVLQIKKVISPTKFFVGPIKDAGKAGRPENNLNSRTDISAYKTADGAGVRSGEQDKVKLKPDDIWAAIYAQEPAVALRNLLVDRFGNPYTDDNPLPINISDLTLDTHLEVQLSHKDNTPNAGDIADSVRMGDGETEVKVHPTNQSISVNTYEKVLPLLANAKWLELLNYEEMQSDFTGNVATLSYLEGGNIVAKAIFTFTSDTSWGFVLESYVNDDDGDILLDDNDTPLFLD